MGVTIAARSQRLFDRADRRDQDMILDLGNAAAEDGAAAVHLACRDERLGADRPGEEAVAREAVQVPRQVLVGDEDDVIPTVPRLDALAVGTLGPQDPLGLA